MTSQADDEAPPAPDYFELFPGLADYVARVVADAPPLSPAQRERIAALLRPHVNV